LAFWRDDVEPKTGEIGRRERSNSIPTEQTRYSQITEQLTNAGVDARVVQTEVFRIVNKAVLTQPFRPANSLTACACCLSFPLREPVTWTTADTEGNMGNDQNNWSTAVIKRTYRRDDGGTYVHRERPSHAWETMRCLGQEPTVLICGQQPVLLLGPETGIGRRDEPARPHRISATDETARHDWRTFKGSRRHRRRRMEAVELYSSESRLKDPAIDSTCGVSRRGCLLSGCPVVDWCVHRKRPLRRRGRLPMRWIDSNL